MKKRKAASRATLLLIALTTSALAAEPNLKVGDPAPALKVSKWAQGEPVKEFQKGKAYIVEFWATWCGPCRVSIPHLNEIHDHYKAKGLIVIGQDCWEKDESLVGPFIKKMGDKMTYRVALDDKEGSEKGRMAETWMEAAGQNGIPTAFLIDLKGIIAWIGHPMELKDEVIEKVLTGKFDVAAAAADFEKRRANEAKLRPVWTALNQAMRKKDWDTAATKLDEAEQLLPEDERSNLGSLRFHLLIGKKNYKEAYQLASTLSDAHKDDAMLQNQLAWDIATDPSIEDRNLELAAMCAARAEKASKSKDPNIIDTVARIAFMQGKHKEAITLEEKAVKLAEGDSKKSFQQTLDSYKQGELPKAE